MPFSALDGGSPGLARSALRLRGGELAAIRAEAELRSGNAAGALALVSSERRRRPLGPEEASLALAGGEALLSLSRHAEARPWLEEALKALPNSPRAGAVKLSLAEALLKEGRGAEAVGLLTQAAGDVDPPILAYDLGLAYMKVGNFVQAASSFEQSEQKAPPGALRCYAGLLRAEALYGAGAFGQGAAEAGQVASSCGGEVALRARYNQGWCLIRGQAWEKARDSFRSFLNASAEDLRHPLRGPARLSLGLSLEKTGDNPGAREQYELTRQELPGSPSATDAAYCLAALAAQEGDWSKALEHYASFLDGNPESSRRASARFLMGGCYFRQGDYDRAVDSYVRAMREEEAPAKIKDLARTWIGLSYVKLKSYRLARKVFEELGGSAADPETAGWSWVRAGDAALETRDYAEARQDYGRVQSGGLPTDAQKALDGAAALGRGWAWYLEGDFEKARTDFTAAGALAGPEALPDIRLREGDCLYNLKRYGEAEAAFLGADQKGAALEVREEARYRLGWCHYKEGRFAQARELWGGLASGTGPLSGQALYWKGWAWFREGQFLSAAEDFGAVAKRLPGTELGDESDLRKADALFNGGKAAEAIEAYRAVIAKDPRAGFAADAFSALRWAYYQEGKVDLALESAETFVKDFPQHPFAGDVLFWLGQKLYEQGQPARALARFRELAGRPDPGGLAIQALFWQGLCELSLHHLEDAAALFRETAASSGPAALRAEAQFRLSLTRFRQRRFADAATGFSQVGVLEPASPLLPQALYNQALAHRRLEDNAMAVSVLSVLLEKFPSSPAAPKAWLQKGLCLDLMNDEEGSLAAFRAAVSSGDGEIGAESQYYIGEMYGRLEKWGRAATEYEKVADLFPDRKEWVQAALVKAGESWELGNSFGKAIEVYERVLALAPEGAKKDSVLARIKKAQERKALVEKLQQESHELDKAAPKKTKGKTP